MTGASKTAWILPPIAALALGCGGSDDPGPRYLRDCSAVVFFEPRSEVAHVSAVGGFNDWSEAVTPLTDEDGDGVYAARVWPGAGVHPYRLYADGVTHLDRFNPLTLFDARGVENSVLRVPDCDVPALELAELVSSLEGRAEMHLRFLRAASGASIDPDSVHVVLDTQPIPGVFVEASPGDIHLATSGLPSGKHRLTVTARDTRGVAAEAISVPFWIEPRPFDWRDALVYQVVVDRFRRGGGALDADRGLARYHGGDLAGVIEAVESGYFDALGVNTLWLSPLYDNPDGAYLNRDDHESEAYHGYWPVEPREVEPRFGGEAALDLLVEVAHRRGMRVVMDAVMNHVHEDHPYVVEHPGAAWFHHAGGDCVCGFSCPWGTHMEACWFTDFLPDLRFENPEVVERVIEDTAWWLDRFDLDGLRLDAVPMMPRLALRHLRHRVGPGAYLLGETYTGRGGQASIRYYLGNHTLSGQFDFPVMWALRDALAGRASMTDLDAEVLQSEAAWDGSGAVMAPILGNHDVARFLSDMNADELSQPWERPPRAPDRDAPYDLLRVAWTFLLTQPGAPVIYYGDEIGMPGAADPDNRRDMRFGADLTERESSVLRHVRRLGRARACSIALRRGERRALFTGEDLYAYGRVSSAGTPALVVLSRASAPRDVLLEVPADWELAPGADFVDVLGAAVETNGRQVTLTLSPRGSALLLSDACVEVTP